MDEKGSVKLTDRYFDENTEAFLDLEWDPDRQVLMPRRRVATLHNPKAMQLRVSPIEGRHESILRPILTMVASLRRRVRELEARLPESPQEPRSALETTNDPEIPVELPEEAAVGLPEPSDETS